MKKLLLLGFIATNALSQHEHHEHHQQEQHQHEKPDEKTPASEETLRDPHEYSGGYTSHAGPFRDPDSPGHMHESDMLYTAFRMDRLEFVGSKEEKPHAAFEFNTWAGSSFEKLWLKSEGEYFDKKIVESENEIFWSHAVHPYWDTTLGLRYDAGDFSGQGYAALGIQGLAPYWFETSAAFYIGDQGRLAFNAELEYELLFTQRLILEPRLELDVKDLARKFEDEHPSHVAFGLRLRYEFYRRLAPYIGVEQSHYFRTKERQLASEDDENTRTEVLAGLRFWL